MINSSGYANIMGVERVGRLMQRQGLRCLLALVLLLAAGLPAEGKSFDAEFMFSPGFPARTVALAGSFNNWSTTATPMEDSDGDGVWRVVLRLPAGEYQYKFVVNGTVWVTDMKAEAFRDDGFGGKNSVVRVGDLAQLSVPCKVGDGEVVVEALWHEQVPPYVERPDADTVALRLRTRSSDVTNVQLQLLAGPEGKISRFVNMEPFATEGGFTYYRAQVDASGGVLRYRFLVRDGARAVWHGPAGDFAEEPGPDDWYALDVSALRVFQTPAWVRDAVFYQIFPDRFANGDPSNDPDGTSPWGCAPTPHNFFGGDFQGVMDKISYLKDLGITAIWFNPIFESVSNHKYDTADYLRVDDSFGDLDKFRELVDALHAEGIRVILDGVFNHTGDEFWAFQDIIEKGRESRYVNWYYIHDFPIRRYPKPNYGAWWGFADLPKLNMENPEVRRYILDVVTFWMTEVGVDGWRLDVPNEVDHSFWKEFRDHVKSINPEAYIVGEIWHNGSPWLAGDEFDAVMNYVFRDAVLDFFARRTASASELVVRLEKLRADYPAQASAALLNLLGSHDTERVLTAFGGNASRMIPAIVFQMTYPGAPMVYYGDEVGMIGAKDPGCRGTMIWDERKQNRSLLALYRRLMHLRRESAALRRGDIRWLLQDDPTRSFAFMRSYKDKAVIIAVCAGDKPITLDLALGGLPSGVTSFSDALTGRTYRAINDRLKVEGLGPDAAVILISQAGRQ